jgi:proteasome lid subunit RPN8/RPN11
MKLTQQLLHQIHDHLESGYPNEACGVMLGKNGIITEIVCADNQRTEMPASGGESGRNRYLIPHLAYRDIELDADKRGLQVMGFYHSHPDVPARPSKFDLDNATWPGLSYLIVSVCSGKAVETNSWLLREDHLAFDQEPVEISG